MFYIIVYGQWGNCIIGSDGQPTWELDNAILFKSRTDAAQYINDNWKQWGQEADCFRIYEKGKEGK
jgi:hypothetical protein